MARKKQNIDSENIEKKEYEEEEEEYIQVEAEQEKEEEEEAGEEEIQGDILFFVKSSIVYTENQYKSLFGKPKFTNGKTSLGVVRNEKGEESKIIIHDYDFGNDVEILRRMTYRKGMPIIPLLLIIGLVLIILFAVFKFIFGGSSKNELITTTEPPVIQNTIPQEYVEAYNEKINGQYLQNNSLSLEDQNKIFNLENDIKRLTDLNNQANLEVIKLNYQLEYLPNCNEQKDDTKENEDSYKIDYESCMEREKNNKWNIYSGKLFDKLCKSAKDNTECAKIYYDFLQDNN